MTVLDPNTQAIVTQANAANAPGTGSVGAPSTATQSTTAQPDTSASDQVGNIPIVPRGGVSPSLPTQMAQTLNQMPVDSSAKPGTWAKQLLGAAFSAISKRDGSDGSGNPGGAAGAIRGVAGGLSNALAGVGAVGTVPAGGGFLTGLGRAAAYN